MTEDFPTDLPPTALPPTVALAPGAELGLPHGMITEEFIDPELAIQAALQATGQVETAPNPSAKGLTETGHAMFSLLEKPDITAEQQFGARQLLMTGTATERGALLLHDQAALLKQNFWAPTPAETDLQRGRELQQLDSLQAAAMHDTLPATKAVIKQAERGEKVSLDDLEGSLMEVMAQTLQGATPDEACAIIRMVDKNLNESGELADMLREDPKLGEAVIQKISQATALKEQVVAAKLLVEIQGLQQGWGGGAYRPDAAKSENPLARSAQQKLPGVMPEALWGAISASRDEISARDLGLVLEYGEQGIPVETICALGERVPGVIAHTQYGGAEKLKVVEALCSIPDPNVQVVVDEVVAGQHEKFARPLMPQLALVKLMAEAPELQQAFEDADVIKQLVTATLANKQLAADGYNKAVITDEAAAVSELAKISEAISLHDLVSLSGSEQRLGDFLQMAHRGDGTLPATVVELFQSPELVAALKEGVPEYWAGIERNLVADMSDFDRKYDYQQQDIAKFIEIVTAPEMKDIITEPIYGNMAINELAQKMLGANNRLDDLKRSELLLQLHDMFADPAKMTALRTIADKNPEAAKFMGVFETLQYDQDKPGMLEPKLALIAEADLSIYTVEMLRALKDKNAFLQGVRILGNCEAYGFSKIAAEGQPLAPFKNDLLSLMVGSDATERAREVLADPRIKLLTDDERYAALAVGALCRGGLNSATIDTLLRPDVRSLAMSLQPETARRFLSEYTGWQREINDFFALKNGPVLAPLLQSINDPDRIIMSMIAHRGEWEAFSYPEGIPAHQVRRLLAKRLEFTNELIEGEGDEAVKTYVYRETPEPALELLKTFGERPAELFGAETRATEWRLMRLAWTGDITKLPVKASRIDELISDPQIKAAYKQILAIKQADPTITEDDVYLQLKATYDDESWRSLMQKEGSPLDHRVSGQVIRELKNLLPQRKKWQDDRNRWIKEYLGVPIRSSELERAWLTRPRALADGAKDSPNEIIQWGKQNELRMYIEERNAKDPGAATLSPDVVKKYPAVVDELSRVYSAELAYEGLKFYVEADLEKASREAIFKPARTSVMRQRLDDKKQPMFNPESGEPVMRDFTVEILDKRDPRGFSIGPDTGCCMTLNGASRNCIPVGYTDPRYAFFVVSVDGQVRAQSILYIGDDPQRPHESVIVADNIEANAGTDFSQIRDVYVEAFKTFVADNKVEKPISAVHIGEGYTEIKIGDLEPVEPVKPPRDNVYTDARSQRLLIDFNARA